MGILTYEDPMHQFQFKIIDVIKYKDFKINTP
jgi:hypothetical protein